VPIFDQGARGDPNLTVLPVATPYNNGPTIYQSPVVYSTEQFTNSPAIASQYPVSAYPAMGYATYPVNGEFLLLLARHSSLTERSRFSF
jgi:small neutral amino acid transporter SnatA (MarC family)